ncbi:AAWKG family protein [Streptomyces sp. NPDC059631]|uniref:AAWKG family protein n=1 Tax=unclassified Streptomyces TaxID=2593676 RepID=UPI0036971F1B
MPTDNWEHTITQMTGWRMPERKDIQEHVGDSNAAWVNVDVKKVADMHPDDPLVLHSEEKENGFHLEFFKVEKTPFLKDEWVLVSKWQVDVQYLDNQPAEDFLTNSLHALTNLVSRHTSVEASSASGAPNADEGVDLLNFVKLAESFDRTGAFFKAHTDVLANWKNDLGDEQAAWKGTAAGAFYHLLDDLHAKYENYTRQIMLPEGSHRYKSVSKPDFEPKTLHANSLIASERFVFEAFWDLYQTFYKFLWGQSGEIPMTWPDGRISGYRVPATPKDVLNLHLRSMVQWINGVNAHTVGTYNGRFVVDAANYSESSVYGAFIDTSTWTYIASVARDAWTKNVEMNLDEPARRVVSTLQGILNHQLDPNWNTAFSFEDTSNTSLSSEVNEEIAEKKGDDFNKSFDKFTQGINKGFDDLSGGVKDGFGNFNSGLSKLSGGVNDGFNNFNTGLSELSGGVNDGFDSFNTGLSDFNKDLTGGGDNPLAMGGGDLTGGLDGPGGAGVFTPGTSDLLGGNSPTGNLTGNALLNGLGFNTGLPISNIDGSSTLRTGTGVTTTFPDGTSTTRNADGSLTTKFPDGTVRTVTPDGEVKTVDANGHTVTSHLGVGESLSNPDGSSITRNADGSLTQTAEDGTKTTTFTNGTSEIVRPDGQTQITFPDGTVSHLDSDGSLTMDGANGSHVTVHPNGDVTTTDAQGHTTTSHLKPGQSITNADGSTTSVDSKGDIITRHPDGSTTTVHPDGTITTTNATGLDARGNTLTGDSHLTQPDPYKFPTIGNTDRVTHLPNGTVVTDRSDGTSHTRFTDGSAMVTSSDGQFQALPSPAGAAAAAGFGAAGGEGVGEGADPAAAAGAGLPAAGGVSDSQNALGLLSPMMMMAGMNRMGGQQQGGGGSGAERNRETYDDQSMDGAVFQHGMPGPSSPGAQDEAEEWEEEESDSEELLAPRRPATESPYGMPGGGGSRMSTQSGTSWSSDGRDVWGTEDGGLPASIGH